MDTVNVLVIRDPDYENNYIYDAPVNVITIDIGGDWKDYKDFCSCLQAGDEDAVEYEAHMLAKIEHLSPDNPVHEGVWRFFKEARDA